MYVPGGVLPDGTRVVVDGMASFAPGQSCYVFVDERGWVMGGFQGKLGVENGRVAGTGETVASMSRRVEAALDRAGPQAARKTLSAPTPVVQVVSHPATTSASLPASPLDALASTLLTDGFESGSLAGWSVIDPSTWGVTTYRAASGSPVRLLPGEQRPSGVRQRLPRAHDHGTGRPVERRRDRHPQCRSVAGQRAHLRPAPCCSSPPTASYYYRQRLVRQLGGGWVNVSLDLSDVDGQNLSRAPALYVMVGFQSDSTVSGFEGAYFDNVLLEDGSTPPGSPAITSISPGEASAGTDTHVAISGQDFGTARGQVLFSYGRDGVMTIAASDIASWSDTAIDCAVPTGVIDNYSASAGSGPVVVTTSTGAESGPYAFTVPFGYGAAKWASPGATYLVNTSGIDSARRERLVDAGTAAWNGAGSAFRFTDGGTTAALFDDDDLNVISWANGLPSGVIAWAASYINGSTVTQCDIQFSNAFAWGEGAPGSNTMDIQTIAMHEVGHWLRLLDQYMPGDASKVMYGYGDFDQQKRTPMAGDIAGIRWIYPGAPPPPAPTITGFNPTSGSVGTNVNAAPAPTLAGFNPTSGSVGTPVTLTQLHRRHRGRLPRHRGALRREQRHADHHRRAGRRHQRRDQRHHSRRHRDQRRQLHGDGDDRAT